MASLYLSNYFDCSGLGNLSSHMLAGLNTKSNPKNQDTVWFITQKCPEVS